jgi:branched-chain amino acid transport system ATP-binding protein
MALNVAHHAYVLEVGEIVMSGEAKVLAASDEVRKAYLGVA